MPDLNRPIREEITRLTRKELKQALLVQKKTIMALKKSLSAVTKECAELRREMKAVQRRLPKPPAPEAPEVGNDKLKRFRPTSKTVKQIRAKTGLSQGDFAKLLDVSQQAVYLWERKDGRLKLRGKAKEALFAVRGMGKREAKTRLDQAAG